MNTVVVPLPHTAGHMRHTLTVSTLRSTGLLGTSINRLPPVAPSPLQQKPAKEKGKDAGKEAGKDKGKEAAQEAAQEKGKETPKDQKKEAGSPKHSFSLALPLPRPSLALPRPSLALPRPSLAAGSPHAEVRLRRLWLLKGRSLDEAHMRRIYAYTDDGRPPFGRKQEKRRVVELVYYVYDG
jgi:hypothetical protein